MSIATEKLLEKFNLLNEEQLNKTESEIKSEIKSRLIERLTQLNDEEFNKIEALIKVLANKDKHKALELAKKSIKNYINYIEKDDISYTIEIQIINSCLGIIDDENLINKYKDLDAFLAKELLTDLNNIIL